MLIHKLFYEWPWQYTIGLLFLAGLLPGGIILPQASIQHGWLKLLPIAP
jgi:hypothetical protein